MYISKLISLLFKPNEEKSAAATHKNITITAKGRKNSRLFEVIYESDNQEQITTILKGNQSVNIKERTSYAIKNLKNDETRLIIEVYHN